MPMPAATMSKSSPSNFSTGKPFPYGPLMPTMSPGFNSCILAVTLPTFLIHSSKNALLVGDEHIDIGTSPRPGKES